MKSISGSSKMEGIHILTTDSSPGLPCTILELLIQMKVVPFVLVKDFENVRGVTEELPAAIPIILNPHQTFESTIDHMLALPTMDCIFNFDGEKFEHLYRQAYHDSSRSISVCRDNFSMSKIYDDVLDCTDKECTLIVNIVAFPLSSAVVLQGNLQFPALTNAALMNSSPHLRHVFERLFSRNPQRLRIPAMKRKKIPDKQVISNRAVNPVGSLLRKLFTRFNPCCATPGINFLPACSNNIPIKTPEEIKVYIKARQSEEIKVTLRTIQNSALKNWNEICENNFKFTSEHQQQLRRMCQEIERKGEEGRASLLDKINKDVERTRQWDHVLGSKTVDRLISSREREINARVQQFCYRKVAEARRKIDEEIKQHKQRTKGRFYREILDDQVMELVRIKEKYNQRMELLLLPYTGELNILQST